jgi:hypothetical protein
VLVVCSRVAGVHRIGHAIEAAVQMIDRALERREGACLAGSRQGTRVDGRLVGILW